jgi:large subunit ribosomal protein L6
MSKVGKVPVAVPDGVTVDIGRDRFAVSGSHGSLAQGYRPDLVEIRVEDGQAIVERRGDSKQHRAFHGLYRSLLANMVHGVSERWQKTLIIRGQGYRARIQGTTLVLDLGYSNPMEFEVPEGIEIEVPNPNEVVVRGIDKQQVGHVAATIRAFRKPNVYSGKGIRYSGEQDTLKAGKLGGASAA